jgi:hypothetical protein
MIPAVARLVVELMLVELRYVIGLAPDADGNAI